MPFIPLALTRREALALLGTAAGSRIAPVWAESLSGIAPQPYFASVLRALKTLTQLGAPFPPEPLSRIETLAARGDAEAVAQTEVLLHAYTLARVRLAQSGRAATEAGAAAPELIEHGWRLFLIRIDNSAGLRASFDVSPKEDQLIRRPTGQQKATVPDTVRPEAEWRERWIVCALADGEPLSGAPVEYRVLQLFSKDRGRRRGMIGFGTHRGGNTHADAAVILQRGLTLDFDCQPTHLTTLNIRDHNGQGCMAALLIRDAQRRVYPLQAMRIAPDMFFHAHIYRADGETVCLPDGEYQIDSSRGPEYLKGVQSVRIAEGARRIDVRLKRWIDPAEWGWYSGDVHLHAAGCAHYDNPTEGVAPQTMIRHVRGEALGIGEVLTWGSGYQYQRQFFSGQAESPDATLEHPELQQAKNAVFTPRPTPQDRDSLLRYDVELAGFPSGHAGHGILLRLANQYYPGTAGPEDWPSWCLPIFQWAQAQGGLAGFAHCGWGMGTATNQLPNYEIPRFDSNGANEAIVDITHGALGFLAGCEIEPAWELSQWYHLLNCGYRLAFVGETDYPCISDERPGIGRTYVQLEHRPVDDVGYGKWIDNLKRGKLYCGDGRSHFLAFTVNGKAQGESDVALKKAATVQVEATLAARLEPSPTKKTEALRQSTGWIESMSWHLERARIGNSREVCVEVIVNGQPVAQAPLLADGTPRKLRFAVRIEHSSWVALRILPSGHTYPIFVTVGGKPVRASKRSAQWCRACVDTLWEVRSPFIRESEHVAARAAFDHARRTYDALIAECVDET